MAEIVIKSEPSECRTNVTASHAVHVGDKCGSANSSSNSCSVTTSVMTAAMAVTSDKFSGSCVGSLTTAVDAASTPMEVDVKEEMDCESPSSTKPVHAISKHLVSSKTK